MTTDLILTIEKQISLEEQIAAWEQLHIDTMFSEWDRLAELAAQRMEETTMFLQNYDNWKLATPKETSGTQEVIYWCWNCDSEIYEDDKFYDIQIKGRLYPLCEDCINNSAKYA